MSVILNIETSTTVCSVTLSSDGKPVAGRVSYTGPSHASLLSVFIQQIMAETTADYPCPDAVAVSCGPGSYTGLRIGVSTAKGLCYGWGVPLIAVNTLQLLACGLLAGHELPEDALLCPMIDARRMEVYTAVYDRKLELVKPVSAKIIDENSYNDLLDKQQVCFFGNGAAKCRSAIMHPNALFFEGVEPLADNMIALSEAAFRAQRFEDTAYFEPFYLKEFVATVPKVKIPGLA
jgi:tRNA threonylcarbamoyladenosine biosynthesis protein TsaB